MVMYGKKRYTLKSIHDFEGNFFFKRIRGRRIYDNAIEKLKFYAKSVIFYANNYFLKIICYITFEIKMKNWR